MLRSRARVVQAQLFGDLALRLTRIDPALWTLPRIVLIDAFGEQNAVARAQKDGACIVSVRLQSCSMGPTRDEELRISIL
jgi:hypothetical protein